jgi:microcystin-dependent protein
MATKSTLGLNGIPVPVGTLFYHGSSVIPPTFLLCDGASLSKTEYSVLYSVLGDGFGSVDAEHFNLPDLITYPYLQGANAYTPAPQESSVVFNSASVASATIPSLAQAHFAFQSWDLTANINGGVWFDNGQTTQQVQLTAKNAVKADSSDVNSYSGSVTGGSIGYTNNAQGTIQPVENGGSVEPAYTTFVPIIKAWYSFVPPYYEPLPVATDELFVQVPASQAFYPPNPESIYLNDPALSGFIF